MGGSRVIQEKGIASLATCKVLQSRSMPLQVHHWFTEERSINCRYERQRAQ